jgi:4-alpha-glucanotransferase
MDRRGSGILLHVTSLPSLFGIGDLGPQAFKFVDFLCETHQTFWQVLPLNPTSLVSGSSPYASFSAFAGNTLLISPEKLVDTELLDRKDILKFPGHQKLEVDFQFVIKEKNRLLKMAFEKFKIHFNKYTKEYARFCRENNFWLEEYACFITFKANYEDVVWSDWPEEIRNRANGPLLSLRTKLCEETNYQKFLQYIFYKQWDELKEYANDKGIKIIGDIPYYVNYDSAEVWTNPHLFKLDSQKKPSHVAGVPPDYFSETGQLWGNPVYDWVTMKKNNYNWWIQRITQNLKLYDIIRIDHFRGFLAYWEVPASQTTAINGQWVKVPGADLFHQFQRTFPSLPILAEDLGVITDDVRELMSQFNLPGMRVLVFAFDKNLPSNAYAPHNHIKNCVVYTGTHDNNTVKGWFLEETDKGDKKRIYNYLGRKPAPSQINWEMIRLAMMSVANLVIFPLQDILGLNSDCRMNKPATLEGNWKWRLQSSQLTSRVRRRLRDMTILFGRVPSR